MLETFRGALSGTDVLIIAFLVLIDVFLSVPGALVAGTFTPKKLADWLAKAPIPNWPRKV